MSFEDTQTSLGGPDPLADLWQGGGEIDVEPLISRLRSQNRRLRRLNMASFAICILAVVATLVVELVGQLPTRGLLSLLSAVGLGWAFWKYRRDKARLVAAYSEEPGKLLPFLVKRTRAARNLGIYYFVVPLPSVAVGFFGSRWLDPGGSAEVAPDAVLLALVVPVFVAMVALMAWGYRLARRKHRELRELEVLMREMESGQ